jgi:hypothetical protein
VYAKEIDVLVRTGEGYSSMLRRRGVAAGSQGRHGDGTTVELTSAAERTNKVGTVLSPEH